MLYITLNCGIRDKLTVDTYKVAHTMTEKLLVEYHYQGVGVKLRFQLD